jgi:hypothetical protein
VMEVQSHARSHTWLFTSSRIIDYYGPHWNISHPKCRYRFLWLNRYPELKPHALQYLSRDIVPWGTPVYEFAPALVAREYRPDPGIEILSETCKKLRRCLEVRWYLGDHF